MSTLSTKGDKISKQAGKLAMIVSKTTLSVVHALMFLGALILEFAIIHFESLNQASILPREGQYWIAFGIAATATLTAMIGFLGMFEYVHANKIRNDIIHLYGSIFNTDPKLKTLILDAIGDHKKNMLIGAVISIPIAILLQVMLTLLVWEGIPYAIDYFQMEYVQDVTTGEWIKTVHRDSLEKTLQGYSIAYGSLGILVAIFIGWLSPKMKDEDDFVDESWEKYITALRLTGQKVPKNIAEFIQNVDKFDVLGDEDEYEEEPAKPEPPLPAVPVTPAEPAKPAEPVKPTAVSTESVSGLLGAKSILESAAVGISYDTLYNSLMHYCGIDPVNKTLAKSPYPNTDNEVKLYINSGGKSGQAPDKALDSISRKIMGRDFDTPTTGSEEKINSGVKGLIWLDKKVKELDTKTTKSINDINQKEEEKKKLSADLDNAKLTNNTPVITTLEIRIEKLTAEIEELETSSKVDVDNLDKYKKDFNSLVTDLKNLLSSKNIVFQK